jgi:hypothetical protein
MSHRIDQMDHILILENSFHQFVSQFVKIEDSNMHDFKILVSVIVVTAIHELMDQLICLVVIAGEI